MTGKEKQALEILGRVNAVIAGSHVVYASGKHGSAYVNKDAVYPYTGAIDALCLQTAEWFCNIGTDVVLAPALGGIVLTQWTASHLTKLTGCEVLAVYAEKEAIFGEVPGIQISERFVLKRGYDKLVKDKRVLVVEDILTTGGTVKKVVELVRASGGTVIGVGALCNRGGVTAKDLGDVPHLHSLVNITLDAWEEKNCPLCAQGVPINTEVGKGRDFLAKKKA